ncbi:MAG: pilus (MSHA type) biogenesis protein MshL [Variovorax sp.]
MDKLKLGGESDLAAVRESAISMAEAQRASRSSQEQFMQKFPPAEAAPQAPAAEDPLAKRRLSISMQNARIGQLLWILTTEFGIGLAIEPDVLEMPTVANLYLQQVTGREALEHIAKLFDVQARLGADRILSVTSLEEKVFEIELLVGTSSLDLHSGGDVFGGGGSGSGGGASTLQNTVSIKSNLGDKADALTSLTKSIEVILAGKASKGTDGGKTEAGRFTINNSSGTLYVQAKPSRMRAIETFLAQARAFKSRQVQIDAQLIDVQLNDQSEFGIDWNVFGKSLLGRFGADAISLGSISASAGTGNALNTRSITIPGQSVGVSGSTAGGIGYRTDTFSVAINALKGFGAVRVLSNPSILARNGMPAYLSVGSNIRYVQKLTASTNLYGSSASTTNVDVQTDSVFSGVVVAVNAIVKRDGVVELFLHPSQTQVQENSLALVDVGSGNKVTLPVVQTKGMTTTLNVRDGDTVVIGGLIDQQASSSDSGVPMISDIPVVGKAFSNWGDQKVTRELVIVLRVRVM